MLIERADVQKKISSLSERISRVCIIQEGENPPEDPKFLLKELNECYENLENMMKKINKINSVIIVSEGKTIAELIAERDVISKKRSSLEMIMIVSSDSNYRQSKSEIKYITTIDIKEVQKEIDRLAKKYRKIDNEIQAINWSTEVKD